MYRDNVELALFDKINFVMNHGALGDVITSLPAVIHARATHYSGMKMKVWVGTHLMPLIEHLLKPYGTFEICPFEDFPLKKVERQELDVGPTACNSAPYDTHTRNRVHMVDFAFNYLLDAHPDNMSQRSYPVLAPLGKRTIDGRYVVFPVGATSDNKLFRASVMGPIVEWVMKAGYKAVLLGTKTSYVKAESRDGVLEPIQMIDEVEKLPPELLAQCVDLREQTTLLQARDVCGYASAVVGVDGGTIHLAGTTMTNIIYGLTTTLPKHRYVARLGDPNLNIRYVGPRNLACAGCQSNMTLLLGHNFRFCPYNDNLCTELLDPADFIDGLKQLGL